MRDPSDHIEAGDFSIEHARLKPRREDVVTRTLLVSVDPYLALTISRAKAAGEPLPRVMQSRTIGVVVDSGHPEFKAGDHVLGFGAWQNYDVRDASGLRRIDLSLGSIEQHLASLGHSGFTAWVGLHHAGAASGETVLISGAAGAVGSVARVLARRRGCRVVGIAGGGKKGRWLTRQLGFHAVVDYREPGFNRALADAAPEGFDLLFENVGARSLDPALPLMRRHGRVALCGLVGHYENNAPMVLSNFSHILIQSVSILPFSIYDYEHLWDSALVDLVAAQRAGELPDRFTISEGIESLPHALVAMLQGRGLGKHMVRIVH